jgi:hypothetical protein
MGNKLPLAIPADKKQHLVIVGFSYAGFTLAELLWDTYKITIIDRN